MRDNKQNWIHLGLSILLVGILAMAVLSGVLGMVSLIWSLGE